MYKLRDTNSSKFGEGFETYYDPKHNTELQVTFESYLSVAAMLPNILFMFINTAATKLYVNLCVKLHHSTDNFQQYSILAAVLYLSQNEN